MRKSRRLLRYWGKYPRALGKIYAPVRPQDFLSFRRCKDTTFRLRFTNKFSKIFDFFFSPFRVTALQSKIQRFLVLKENYIYIYIYIYINIELLFGYSTIIFLDCNTVTETLSYNFWRFLLQVWKICYTFASS